MNKNYYLWFAKPVCLCLIVDTLTSWPSTADLHLVMVSNIKNLLLLFTEWDYMY